MITNLEDLCPLEAGVYNFLTMDISSYLCFLFPFTTCYHISFCYHFVLLSGPAKTSYQCYKVVCLITCGAAWLVGPWANICSFLPPESAPALGTVLNLCGLNPKLWRGLCNYIRLDTVTKIPWLGSHLLSVTNHKIPHCHQVSVAVDAKVNRTTRSTGGLRSWA